MPIHECYWSLAEPPSTVSQLLDQQQQHIDPQQQQQDRGQKGAAECDEAIGSLRNARSKAEARQRSRSRFAETTLYERGEKLVKVAANGVRAAVMFTFAIPGNVTFFIALPKAERRATYHRWWVATKKEANHYWVRLLSRPSPDEQLFRLQMKSLPAPSSSHWISMSTRQQ